MARPVTLTKQLATAGATKICLSQSGTAGVPLLLNGSTGGVLDTQRRVLFTFAADESAHTFVVLGTNDGDAPIRQTVTGTNTTAATTIDFKTVTSIIPSANTAGALTVGTNGVGSTRWVDFDYHIAQPFLGLGATVNGTAQFSAEYTYEEFLTNPVPSWQGAATPVSNGPDSPSPTVFPLTALKNKSATTDGEPGVTWTIRAWRLTIESGTDPVRLTGIQSGIT